MKPLFAYLLALAVAATVALCIPLYGVWCGVGRVAVGVDKLADANMARDSLIALRHEMAAKEQQFSRDYHMVYNMYVERLAAETRLGVRRKVDRAGRGKGE